MNVCPRCPGRLTIYFTTRSNVSPNFIGAKRDSDVVEEPVKVYVPPRLLVETVIWLAFGAINEADCGAKLPCNVSVEPPQSIVPLPSGIRLPLYW
jgi:hypothetical protein